MSEDPKPYTNARPRPLLRGAPLTVGRLPPQALDTEAAVLGAIMLERDKLEEVLRIIRTPECFYKEAHQKIYEAIRRVHTKGSPVDLLTVTSEMHKSGSLEAVGGAYYLTTLTADVTSSAHVEAHARIVAEKWVGREMIRVCSEAVTTAYDDSEDVFELHDRVMATLSGVTDQLRSGEIKRLGESLMPTLEEMRQAQLDPGGMIGVSTGLTKLDEQTRGLQRSQLTIVAGATGGGKTTLVLNILDHIATNKEPAALFSLEMRDRELVHKVLSSRIRENVNSVMSGNFSEEKWAEVEGAIASQLYDLPLWVYDVGGLNVVEFKGLVRRLVKKHGVKVVGVDYLQLMRGIPGKRYGTREQEVNDISKELKALAMELDISIIALSQLSRMEKGAKSRPPVLSDLRESGAIEQDANNVWFIYWPHLLGEKEVHIDGEDIHCTEMDAFINIAKARSGKRGWIRVRFDAAFNKFSDEQAPDVWEQQAQSFAQPYDNPRAGITRDPSEFGGSKLFIPGGFQPVDYTQPKSEQQDGTDDMPF